MCCDNHLGGFWLKQCAPGNIHFRIHLCDWPDWIHAPGQPEPIPRRSLVNGPLKPTDALVEPSQNSGRTDQDAMGAPGNDHKI